MLHSRNKDIYREGFQNIEAIKVGDYVWSENPETKEKALKKVKKIFVREKDSIIRLAINGEVIDTTDEHPSYVEGMGFTEAKLLKAGDEVRLATGNTAEVNTIESVQLDKPIKVYNFEVEDYHTYYVSEQKVLVHNTCAVKIESYGKLSRDKTVIGQAHHISQNAAFGKSIPRRKGLAIKLEGHATADIDSAHYKAHAVLEAFWNQYRKGGALHGSKPLVGQYNRAAYDSLVAAGIPNDYASVIIQKAYAQQRAYGLSNNSYVPNLPGLVRQKKIKK